MCGPSDQYGLVVDAGSSGTRLRIYCWPPFSWAALPKISDVVLQRDTGGLNLADATLRRRPGLAEFVRSPDQAVAQVLSLVDEARQQWVPDDRAASALLYVKATAGLRLLPVRQAELLLEAVSNGLSNRTRCPFSFVDARVISGEEEALFGWLSANVLLGRLGHASSAHSDSVGWLDLGGASAQLAHTLQPGSSTSEERAAHVACASAHVGCYGWASGHWRLWSAWPLLSPWPLWSLWSLWERGASTARVAVPAPGFWATAALHLAHAACCSARALATHPAPPPPRRRSLHWRAAKCA